MFYILGKTVMQGRLSGALMYWSTENLGGFLSHKRMWWERNSFNSNSHAGLVLPWTGLKVFPLSRQQNIKDKYTH